MKCMKGGFLQIVVLSWLYILFIATIQPLRKNLVKGHLHGLLFQVKSKQKDPKPCDMCLLWGSCPVGIRFWS